MKVWITKYALMHGILERTGESCPPHGMIQYGIGLYAHGEGREWHRTRESAIKRAESMRAKKIVSLEKSIEKMKALQFVSSEGSE